MTGRVQTDIKTPAARAVRLPVPALTDRQKLDAATAVARRAHGDRRDFRELLDAVGLDVDEVKALRAAARARAGEPAGRTP